MDLWQEGGCNPTFATLSSHGSWQILLHLVSFDFDFSSLYDIKCMEGASGRGTVELEPLPHNHQISCPRGCKVTLVTFLDFSPLV